MTDLDLDTDVVTLTAALCDRESVSGDEEGLADAIETALRGLAHLEVTRDGNTVVARTELGRAERVVLAGHIDTVPLTEPPNLPTRREGEELHGRGTVDMKGGVAVQLRLAAAVTEPSRDITFVFYDCEEVESERNGLARVGPPPRPSCSTATSPSCSSRPTAPSRGAARARCGSTSPPAGWPRTPPAPGTATTPSTRRERCWAG